MRDHLKLSDDFPGGVDAQLRTNFVHQDSFLLKSGDSSPMNQLQPSSKLPKFYDVAPLRNPMARTMKDNMQPAWASWVDAATTLLILFSRILSSGVI
jgi:hypothetical protein